jgi:biotin-(acetyl-CoA carboxylase) ligase
MTSAGNVYTINKDITIGINLAAGKKTLLRIIRITQELEDLLQKDAKLKRISVNALISSIMTKYAEWDRYRERVYAAIGLSHFVSMRDIYGTMTTSKKVPPIRGTQ